MSGSQQLLLAAIQQALPDPNFEYTTLLLPGNGTNGAQNNTFLDSSTNNFTITRNGNTTQGTFSPFSQTGWGNYLNGSTDYLTAASNAAFAVPAEYTVEFWAYQVASPTNYASYFLVNVSNGLQIGFNTAGGGVFGVANNLIGWQLTTAAFPLNQWTHIAITRDSSNVTRIFYNGTQQTSGTITTSYAQGGLRIGNSGANNGFINGYVSNMRYLKGTALYTSNFTPPTSPLTAITNTQLLTCQSNRFKDNSSNSFALTTTGSPSIQAFSPFNPTASWSAATNGGSGYFDGSGDYLTTTGTSSFNPSTGNWTFEAWCYFNNASNNDILVNGTASGADKFYILWVSSTFYLGDATSNTIVASSSKPLNQWFHIAVVKNGSTYTAYLNGVSIGTSTTALASSTITTFEIGARISQSWFTSGYIANFRYSQSAIYTTTFTPPTSPVTGGALLLNFTNAGIYDATSKNDLETVGNAQISTTQSKFGGSSMYFDGTDDGLRFYEILNTQFGTGDFTVEAWVYITSFSVPQVVVDARGSTTAAAPWQFYVNASNKVVFNYGSNLIGTISVAASTWTHIAAARYGSTLRIFVNGILDSSATTSASLNGVSGQPVYVGRVYDPPGSPYFSGYIDDLRITKGIARYTSNFTPPTTAFLTL